MMRRSLLPAWVGILALSGMFLMGQDTGQKTEFVSFSYEEQRLYGIDPLNCAQTQLADLSSYSLAVTGLTFQSRNVLYMFDHAFPDSGHLYSVVISNPASPIVTLKGTCPSVYAGLAFCGDGKLYGIGGTPTDEQLFVIDPSNCGSTLIGSLGHNLGNKGMTCHPTTGVLYAFGSQDDLLYTIDKTTGLASPVGSLGVDIQGGVGIEFDPLSEKLYGSLDEEGDGIHEWYEIDPETGAGSSSCSLDHAGRGNLGARVISTGW